MHTLHRRTRREILWMVAPAVLTLIVFSLYPLVYSIAMSLSDSQLARPFRAFVAFKNYTDAVADALFRGSILLTFVYAFGVTAIETALGFGLALLLNRESRASRFARTLGLLPFITPPVAIAAIWRLIYDPSSGMLNHYLVRAGILEQNVAFLGIPGLAMASVMLVDVWQWTPFVFLLSLAVLASLPHEPYEAAAVDGANTWQQFVHITLPLCLPGVLIIAILRLIGAMKVFDLVFMLTSGGPGASTQVASFYIYKTAFQQFKTGYASAMTIILIIVLTILVTLLTVLYRKAQQRYGL
ncbi:MAG: sugar ABC transporter permease [Anaerolineae bacterium]|jgi:multiple sugar transport system permease protein|nr:sugar ABC transporter permease [Anaerolineae bacterium]